MKNLNEGQIATKQLFSDLSILPTLDGVIYLKHINGSFGYITDENVLGRKYHIFVRESSDELIFDSVDALIAAGWTID